MVNKTNIQIIGMDKCMRLVKTAKGIEMYCTLIPKGSIKITFTVLLSSENFKFNI